MKIEKLIDTYGDDVFALALMVTKDFDSAKKIFIELVKEYYKIPDTCAAYDEVLLRAYALCKDADTNDSAITLTGVELDSKREALLQIVLQKPQIVRTIIHLHFEHELDDSQIAAITGESVKYITKVLSEFPPELTTSLERHYMEICSKIHAEDSLKAYVIRSASEGEKRTFEVRDEAMPRHTWSKKQKLIVVIAAVVAVALITIVIPLLNGWIKMEEELRDYTYEEAATDEIFAYTTEADEVTDEITQ